MEQWLTGLDAPLLLAMAVMALGLAVFVIGSSLLLRIVRQARSRQTVDRALARRASTIGAAAVALEEDGQSSGRLSHAMGAATRVGLRWKTGRYGMLLLAREDRELVDVAGYQDADGAKAIFLISRVAACLLLPLTAWLWLGSMSPSGNAFLHVTVLSFIGFAIGWMLPKWLVLRRVRRRRQALEQELPLLIDLLRLLQGVGLSVDQSLQVVVQEFGAVMPVLASELSVAIDQHARGRSREQSLQRLSMGFDNEDLSAICRLIVQVDQHGGATQEPLRHFSERLREQRKLDLKERIGRLTVKMTGVMVLTLMPALLIVTGGAGFLAVIRGLSRVGGG